MFVIHCSTEQWKVPVNARLSEKVRLALFSRDVDFLSGKKETQYDTQYDIICEKKTTTAKTENRYFDTFLTLLKPRLQARRALWKKIEPAKCINNH